MFLNFLPFFMMQVDENNNLELVNSSWKVPVFLFCFSPYCGYCKQVHPYWIKVAEKFKDDPHLIAAELDCVAHNDLCSNYYKVTGYPSFVTMTKGKQKIEHDIDRTYPGILKHANKLKAINLDELCNRWNDSFISDFIDDYPAFVLSTTGDLKSSCSIIDKLCDHDVSALDTSIYAKIEQREMSFMVHLSNITKIEMKESFSLEEAKKFYKKYSERNFVMMKMKDLMEHKRPLVIMITKDLDDVKKLKYFAANHYNYYWAVISYQQFDNINNGIIPVDDERLPVAIVTNEKKNMYVLVHEANEKLLKPIVETEFKELKGIKNKRLKLVFRDTDEEPENKEPTRLELFGLICVITAIIIFAANAIKIETKDE